MFAIRRSAAWCLIGLLIAAAPVHSAVITVEFAGTFSDSTNLPEITAGESFNGSFLFVDGALASGTLNIPRTPPVADFSFGPVAPGTGSLFEVIDGVGGVDPDSILVELRPAVVVAWPPGGNVNFWSVELVDDEGTAFPPVFPPDLPAFDVWNAKRFFLGVGCPATEGCTAMGVLSSFEVQSQSVPEPASVLLLIAALGTGLWFARRRPQRI